MFSIKYNSQMTNHIGIITRICWADEEWRSPRQKHRDIAKTPLKILSLSWMINEECVYSVEQTIPWKFFTERIFFQNRAIKSFTPFKRKLWTNLLILGHVGEIYRKWRHVTLFIAIMSDFHQNARKFSFTIWCYGTNIKSFA